MISPLFAVADIFRKKCIYTIHDTCSSFFYGKCCAIVLYYREIAKHLSLPPVKLHCSMLAEDAIKAAVKDYEAKRAKGTTSEAAPSEKAASA